MLTALSTGMIVCLCFDLELHPCELHRDPGHHNMCINVMDMHPSTLVHTALYLSILQHPG